LVAHIATLLAIATLPNYGTVVVAGPDLSAESFDPATGTFSLVGNSLPAVVGGTMQAVRGRTAFPSNDGTAVIAGGYGIVTVYRFGAGGGPGYGCLAGEAKVSVAAAELFAPESEGFTATGSLNTGRYGHAATVLADGTVLVTGGVLGTVRYGHCGSGWRSVPISSTSTVLSSAELYK
jgi:hypothetical protein